MPTKTKNLVFFQNTLLNYAIFCRFINKKKFSFSESRPGLEQLYFKKIGPVQIRVIILKDQDVCIIRSGRDKNV